MAFPRAGRGRIPRVLIGIALAAGGLTVASTPPAAATTRTAVCAPGAVYAVDPDNGRLYWWGDPDPVSTGGFTNAAPIGTGWGGVNSIVAGGGGVIYAVVGGSLRWYRHTDPVGGAASWASGSGKVIGPSGWDSFSYILSAGNGVLLAIDAKTYQMRWYRYTDPVGGNGTWASGSGTSIGSNWNFSNVFSGGAGIVYAVSGGNLIWYRYSDPYNGHGSWSSHTIGQGWGFASYLPDGGGVIYGIRSTGALGSYRHTDPYAGAATWATNPDYGSGWDHYLTASAKPTADPSACGATEQSAVPFIKTLARGWLSHYGWSDDQFDCLDQIWIHESGWVWSAKNPSSGAYGIPQSLPASKMASAGADYLTNPLTQIAWGLGYIRDRYATPCDAWAFWQTHSWY